MKLSPMRYKDYIWPHNPKIYSISYKRRVSASKLPFGRTYMQDTGLEYRVLKGEGEFFGEGAYDEFKKLATVFYSGGPGLLIHPVWQSANAYFVRLTLEQEPVSDYVLYSFEFWETVGSFDTVLTEAVTVSSSAVTTENAAATEKKYYTVRCGDTLWGIAQSYGLTLGELLELNPQIKNPNLIYAGNEVRIG